MRTTDTSRRKQRSAAEWDRERAWAHLLQESGGSRRTPVDPDYGHTWLVDIARSYDRICRRAKGLLRPDASETDVLAALLVIRGLRDKLDADELMLITLARSKKITWTRIAGALEMRSRQAAERRHLQLSIHDPDDERPRTQSEQVDAIRERRSRRAERDWALSHAKAIRTAAQELAGIPDLQERADHSPDAAVISAVHASVQPPPESTPASPSARMLWPGALRECLVDDARFHTDPQPFVKVAHQDLADTKWGLRQAEATILSRMLGLVTHAADPRHVDLSDRPQLFKKIVRLDLKSPRATLR